MPLLHVRTTIDQIIPNLNVRGEEERKRAILASYRVMADILYHLNWKPILLVLIFVVVV